MGFVDTATLCLEPWDATIIIAHVKKPVLFSLRNKIREVLKKRAAQTTKTTHTSKGL